MNRNAPGWLAYLSLCGFVISVVVYVAAFSESMAGYAALAFVPLILALLPIAVTLYATEDPSLRSPAAFWNGIPGLMSQRMILLQRLLAVGMVAHVTWAAWESRRGVPAIIDGQYVLESNGKVFETITRSDYVSLHGGLLRTFAFMLTFLYFLPLTYSWVGQRSETNSHLETATSSKDRPGGPD